MQPPQGPGADLLTGGGRPRLKPGGNTVPFTVRSAGTCAHPGVRNPVRRADALAPARRAGRPARAPSGGGAIPHGYDGRGGAAIFRAIDGSASGGSANSPAGKTGLATEGVKLSRASSRRAGFLPRMFRPPARRIGTGRLFRGRTPGAAQTRRCEHGAASVNDGSVTASLEVGVRPLRWAHRLVSPPATGTCGLVVWWRPTRGPGEGAGLLV